MSNIILLDKHIGNAVEDSRKILQAPIVDHNGKPISARDVESELDLEEEARKRNFKFILPVGAGWRYYKVRQPGSDKWFVGYVKNRPIPKNTDPISPRKAFEMMYGVSLTEGNEAKRNWAKISDEKQGYVKVSLKKKSKKKTININNPEQSQQVMTEAQKFKL